MILQFTDLLFGQASPLLLDASLYLNEVVLRPLHVDHLRFTIALLQRVESGWSFKEVNTFAQLVFNTTR